MPIWTSYTDDATAVLPSITRQPSAATYAKSAETSFYVNASSVDGGYLTYQWYISQQFPSPLATNPDGTLTSASQTTIYNSRTAISGDAGKKAVLDTTTPAIAGYYYYWVEITNNLDANGNGTTADPGETAIRESAYARARVVDRTLGDRIINGDFQSGTYNRSLYATWWDFIPVQGGTSWIPYWDTTHDGSSSTNSSYQSLGSGKVIELQNASTPLLSTAGQGDWNEASQTHTSANAHFADLAAAMGSAPYQEIATVPGKIYEWSLDHNTGYSAAQPDIMAVIIGPAINTADDYLTGTTSRYIAAANYSTTAGNYIGTRSYTYPYGKNMVTFFNDIVNTLGNQTQLIALAGQSRVVRYNGQDYYVYISSAAKNGSSAATQMWTHRSGIYTVPQGQGTTVFAFVTVRSWQGDAGGNYLDNIEFKSGSEPTSTDTITYTGNTSLSTTTKAGYAYALAEIRGSTVISLTGLSATFNSTATTPNASLGTGSWYTPNAAGTLTFTGLTPGKNYRIIGIPTGSINAALNTNMGPADV
ncbi:MAG: hypothetical protein LBU31_04060, partial [Coriobacteriales bacterium]|nr:hypothetical protein [Coriobacteriales bacterium]